MIGMLSYDERRRSARRLPMSPSAFPRTCEALETAAGFLLIGGLALPSAAASAESILSSGTALSAAASAPAPAAGAPFSVCRKATRSAFSCLLRPSGLISLDAARPLDAAAIVEIDHRLKRRHRAVVHVRRAARDVAQRRRLEGVLQLDRGRKQLAAADIVVLARCRCRGTTHR